MTWYHVWEWPKTAWIIIVCLVAVVAAIVSILYLVVMKKTLTDMMANGNIVKPGQTFMVGSTVTLTYKSTHIAHNRITWSYTTDKGATWIPIKSGATAVTSWIVPSTVFTNGGQFKVEGGGKTLLSPGFISFKPILIMTTGARPGHNFMVDSTIELQFTSTSSLLVSAGITLSISADGVTYSPLDPTVYSVHVSADMIQLKLPSSMVGNILYFQMTTTNMISGGFPSELTATSGNPINIIAGQAGAVTALILSNLVLYANPAFSDVISVPGIQAYMMVGETVYCKFSTTSILTSNDYAVQYNSGNTGWIALPVTDLGGNAFQFNVPRVADTDDFGVRVQQLNTNAKPFPMTMVNGLHVSTYLHSSYMSNMQVVQPTNLLISLSDVHIYSTAFASPNILLSPVAQASNWTATYKDKKDNKDSHQLASHVDVTQIDVYILTVSFTFTECVPFFTVHIQDPFAPTQRWSTSSSAANSSMLAKCCDSPCTPECSFVDNIKPPACPT